MSRIREQAIELLQNIPDDKIIYVIELLKGLQVLYSKIEIPAVQEVTPKSAMGICSKYANPALIPLEKEAWGEAVKEKHATH